MASSFSFLSSIVAAVARYGPSRAPPLIVRWGVDDCSLGIAAGFVVSRSTAAAVAAAAAAFPGRWAASGAAMSAIVRTMTQERMISPPLVCTTFESRPASQNLSYLRARARASGDLRRGRRDVRAVHRECGIQGRVARALERRDGLRAWRGP